VTIIFIRHGSEDQPDDPVLVGIHPDLSLMQGGVVKTFPSAFMQTDLMQVRERLKADDLSVCGLATFGCVNATVMCALCWSPLSSSSEMVMAQ